MHPFHRCYETGGSSLTSQHACGPDFGLTVECPQILRFAVLSKTSLTLPSSSMKAVTGSQVQSEIE